MFVLQSSLTTMFSRLDPSKTSSMVLSFLSARLSGGKLCLKSKSLNFSSN